MARLVALPEGHNNPDGLAEAIRAAKGRTLLPETTAGGWGDRNAAPRSDWKPARLGADPPPGLVSLRGAVESTVLSCFGIPTPLGPAGVTDGTAQREAARRLWQLTVQPLAALVSEELSRVLERDVRLTFGRAAQGRSDGEGARRRRPGQGRRRPGRSDEARMGRMTTAQITTVVRAAQDAGPEFRAALAVLFAPVPAALWDELAAAVDEAQDAIAGRLPTRAALERAKRDPLGRYNLDEWTAPPGRQA